MKTSSTSNLFSLLSSTPTSNPSAERDASPAHSLHSPEDAGPRVLVNVSDSPAKPDGNIWIVKLELYYTDKAILESSDKWLNDSIVCAAQTLLCEQRMAAHPMCKEAFSPLPAKATFIQILHVSSCHWIMVSNVDPKDRGRFYDYDSKECGSQRQSYSTVYAGFQTTNCARC